jgi:hypothetical protein
VFSGFLDYWTLDKIKKTVIPSVMYHHHNPLGSTCEMCAGNYLCMIFDGKKIYAAEVCIALLQVLLRTSHVKE